MHLGSIPSSILGNRRIHQKYYSLNWIPCGFIMADGLNRLIECRYIQCPQSFRYLFEYEYLEGSGDEFYSYSFLTKPNLWGIRSICKGYKSFYQLKFWCIIIFTAGACDQPYKINLSPYRVTWANSGTVFSLFLILLKFFTVSNCSSWSKTGKRLQTETSFLYPKLLKAKKCYQKLKLPTKLDFCLKINEWGSSSLTRLCVIFLS